MSHRLLEHLFGSPVKAKLLKLFVYNPDTFFPFEEVRRRTQVPGPAVTRELHKLVALGFVRVREVAAKRPDKLRRATARLVRPSRASGRGRRVKAYQTNPDFALFTELKALITKTSPASRERMLEKLRSVGRIKFVILAGIFIGSETSRADIMIVGEHLGERRLKDFIENLEAEVGKELTCVALSTDDFRYRYTMFDRFVRDMLDYPHEVLINKLKV